LKRHVKNIAIGGPGLLGNCNLYNLNGNYFTSLLSHQTDDDDSNDEPIFSSYRR